MKTKEIAQRYILDLVISAATSRYDETMANGIADQPLTPSQHEKVKKRLRTHAERMYAVLVKNKVVLDGITFPWQTPTSE